MKKKEEDKEEEEEVVDEMKVKEEQRKEKEEDENMENIKEMTQNYNVRQLQDKTKKNIYHEKRLCEKSIKFAKIKITQEFERQWGRRERCD